MGEKLEKKKMTAAPELPEEIIRKEILTQVPIKDVVRFMSASKSWLSLFSDAQFVKDHLTRCSTQNPNDYDRLIAKKHNRIVILSRYNETLMFPFDHRDRFALIGSIRGLICLSSDRKLSLWNPAIHQSKEITRPTHSSRKHAYGIVGFGFDCVNNDYKVVVLWGDLTSATVYSSNSDSWIDVSVVPDIASFKSTQHQYVIVKDCPYWTFQKHREEDRHPRIKQLIVSTAVSFIVVKFDAVSNEFKLLPEFYYDIRAHGHKFKFWYEFVDMNDRLTLMLHDQNSLSSVVDIYSLDGDEGCCVWSKMYSIGPINFHTQQWCVSLSQGFKYGGEIVYHVNGMFSCYDHETDTIKSIDSDTTPSRTAPHSTVSCFRYTPSLVFLQGMKSVYLTTQTRRTPGLCIRAPRRLITSLRD